MSALSDRSQNIRFHYGNAAVELSHLLPPDELSSESQSEISEFVNSPLNETLESLVARNEELLEILKESQTKLSYLLRDLKRQIG